MQWPCSNCLQPVAVRQMWHVLSTYKIPAAVQLELKLGRCAVAKEFCCTSHLRGGGWIDPLWQQSHLKAFLRWLTLPICISVSLELLISSSTTSSSQDLSAGAVHGCSSVFKALSAHRMHPLYSWLYYMLSFSATSPSQPFGNSSLYRLLPFIVIFLSFIHGII